MKLRSLIAASVAVAGLSFTATQTASAQERYIGEIITVGFNFCPRGTARADGQLLAINSNQALFSLYGTYYGGDGRTSFGLPDLRGRSPVHNGQGPGLTERRLGERGGMETQTLTTANLPSHSHEIYASTTGAPSSGTLGATVGAADESGTTANTGGSQSFSITDPYLVVNYCVVTMGVFPSRN